MAKVNGVAGEGTRKMARGRFRKIGVFLVMVYLIALLYGWFATKMFERKDLISDIAGSGFAVLFIFFLYYLVRILRDKKLVNDPIDRAIRGAVAEETIEQILNVLPTGYFVHHDLSFSKGNIDHVVVGPTGIFVIETKSHKGTVTISPDGKVLINAKEIDYGKDFVSQTLSQAFWLKDYLSVGFVNGVLVFTRAYVKGNLMIKRVSILNKKYLVDHIIKKRSVLSVDEIERVHKLLGEIRK